MHKVIVVTVLTVLMNWSAAAETSQRTGDTAVILIGDGTKIHIASSDRIEASARTISTVMDRTELTGDVRIAITRRGENVLHVEAQRAVVVVERRLPE